jgi:hypothetical protein
MDHASKLQTSKGGSSVTNGAAHREPELIDRREALLGSEPNLRGRAVADRLGVSEAQLLMSDRGGSVRFLRAVPSISRFRASGRSGTRNAIHMSCPSASAIWLTA